MTPKRTSGDGRPELSVVVIMFTSRAHLLRCLDALAQQHDRVDLEVILPHDDSLVRPDELNARYPGIRLLPFPGRRTPAELRAAAVAVSRAPIVALVEDHCMPAASWCARVIESHSQPYAAVGGPVEKGFPPGRTGDSALNWAVYLTDYSRYMLPIPSGAVHSLSDCNVSYKRSAIDTIGHLWTVEFHENLVNGALEASGESLWLDAEMVVFEQRDLDLGTAVRDRYTFGRLFGSTRVLGAPFARRIGWVAAALLMSPVLVMRVGRNLMSRGRHQAQFIRCLPALILVSTAWMSGEAIGYLTGSAGRSLVASRDRGGGHASADQPRSMPHEPGNPAAGRPPNPSI